MARGERQHARQFAAPEMTVTAFLILAVLRVATPVMALATGSARLPQWDMAKYGVSGLRLARALQDVDLLAFLSHLNGLDVWPPVFPLLEVPVFLLAGPSYASARGLIAVLFAATIVAAFWSGLQSHRRLGITVGALTATLVATSPMAQVFATVVMLEVPGTLLLLLAVGFYLRSLEKGHARDFTFACVAATTLFFCKYNYGLIWILPMMTNEILRAHGSSGVQFSESLKRLTAALRRPWPAILGVGLVVAAIIEISGPWRFSIGSRAVSVSSAGLLLYTLYVLTLVGWFLRPRRSLQTARQLLERLDPRARSMLTFIAFPVALWMVVPSHTINFVGFLVNRSAGLPVLGLESLLFYPRVFIGEFSPSPAVGIAVLLVAASSLRKLRGSDEAGRVVALALLFSTIAALAHPYKQPRFFFLSAALLWFAGSREAMELLSWPINPVRVSTQRWIAATLAGSVLLTAAVTATDVDRLLHGHRQLTVNASTEDVLNAITDEAAKVQASVLLGTWNHLSPWLVEWSCLQRDPSMDPDQVPQEPTGRSRRGNVVKWLATDPPDLLMVLSTAPGTQPRPGFVAETRWLEPVRRQLARDSRFELVSRKDFQKALYRLESFEATRTDGEPVPR
jgi:hypothetical protein